jgi:hypothetical protein
VVVLTSDGVLHYTLKTDKYDVATLSTVQWSAKKQHPQGVSGLHFHPGKSVLALVGPSKDPSTGCFICEIAIFSLDCTLQLIALYVCVEGGTLGPVVVIICLFASLVSFPT